MSRTKRSLLNLASSVMLSAATLVTGFFGTPWLLHWLGEERFGAFRAAQAWGGYLEIFQLGLIGALLPLLARALGRSDELGLRNTLVMGIRTYGALCALALIGGGLLAYGMPWLVRASGEISEEVQSGFAIGLFALLGMPLAPFQNLAIAEQRGYFVHALNLLQCLATTGLALFLAWKSWGIEGQFLAYTLPLMLVLLALAWNGLRRHPGLLRQIFSLATPEETKKEMWSLNFSAWATSLCFRVSILSDQIVVARFMGAAAVVPFFATQRLPSLVGGQMHLIGLSAWAGMAELHAQKQHEVFNRRLVELTSLTALAGTALLVPVLIYNRYFVEKWLGAQCFGGETLALAAVASAFFLGLAQLWRSLLVGTGEVRALVPMDAAHAAANLAFSLGLTFGLSLQDPALGLAGPVLGTLLAYLVTHSWWFPILLRRVYGVSAAQLVKAALRPWILGVPYVVGLHALAQTYPPEGWTELALSMAGATLTFMALAWLALLRQEERSAWRVRAKLALGMQA